MRSESEKQSTLRTPGKTLRGVLPRRGQVRLSKREKELPQTGLGHFLVQSSYTNLSKLGRLGVRKLRNERLRMSRQLPHRS